MKSLIVLLFFVGMFMITSGIYEQKLKTAETNTKIEYRFVPRTYYEEQMAPSSDLMGKMGDAFDHVSPWFDRNVGAGLDVLKTDKIA